MTSVSIDDKLAKELEQLAQKMGRPIDALAADAVRNYVEYTRRFLAEIEAGIADADAGRVVSADEVRAELARRRAARAAQKG